MLLSLTPILLVAAAGSTFAQQSGFTAAHNTTSIIGTWSSGSRGVVTGPGFANPVAYSFNYPKTTGISYSFSDDGWFEEAHYRFKSNGSMPHCIVGIVRSQHGKYHFDDEGQIIMEPLPEDGRIQVQNTCPSDGISNVITQFNVTVTMKSWRIFTDLTDGPKLHLFQFDGAPLAPMFLVQKDPIMLAKKSLTQAELNGTSSTTTPTKRSWTAPLFAKRSDAPSLSIMSGGGAVLAGAITLGLAMLL